MSRDEVHLDLASLIHFKLALVSLARDDKRERTDTKGIVRSAKVKQARQIQIQGITQWSLRYVNQMAHTHVLASKDRHEMLLRPKRKAAVAGNFVQVFRAAIQLRDYHNFDDYKNLMSVVKKLCGPAFASNLSNRDLCELA